MAVLLLTSAIAGISALVIHTFVMVPAEDEGSQPAAIFLYISEDEGSQPAIIGYTADLRSQYIIDEDLLMNCTDDELMRYWSNNIIIVSLNRMRVQNCQTSKNDATIVSYFASVGHVMQFNGAHQITSRSSVYQNTYYQSPSRGLLPFITGVQLHLCGQNHQFLCYCDISSRRTIQNCLHTLSENEEYKIIFIIPLNCSCPENSSCPLQTVSNRTSITKNRTRTPKANKEQVLLSFLSTYLELLNPIYDLLQWTRGVLLETRILS